MSRPRIEKVFRFLVILIPSAFFGLCLARSAVAAGFPAAVSAGVSHSLGLKSDGTVWAWGSNDSGKLGNGSYTGSYVPVSASGLSEVVAISAGDLQSLALKTDGTVWAWGRYFNSPYTNGPPPRRSDVPVPIYGLSGIAAVSAGFVHSLVLKSDGTVLAWGENGSGELGNGSNVISRP